MSDLLERMRSQISVWDTVGDHRVIFLTCYSMMTANMLRAVSNGEFQDGTWVTGLTHCFADYYFDALELYEASSNPPVWTFTFETACHKRAHVLQNLLLGVNAHICYDLIFALADSIGNEWNSISVEQRIKRYQDYSRVNHIIGLTLDAVQDEVVEPYSRVMAVVDYAFGRLDEWMIHTLIKRWREQVWGQSIAYVVAPTSERMVLQDRYIENAEQRSRAIQGQRGLMGIVDLF